MKKRLSILVALVMLLSLAIPFGASAAQFGDLTITINPPQTLNGLTFDLHKVFDLTTTTDGYTYVIAPGFASFPVPATYSSLRAYVDYVGTLAPAAQEPLLRDLGANLATFIGGTAPARSVVGSGQSVTTTNLDAGYYLIITRITGTNVIESVRFALISIEEGTAPYVLNIGRKIDAPHVDKEIEGGDDPKWTNAKVGDVIDYKVTATVPGNIDDYDNTTGYIRLRDTMVNLTYVTNSLQVTLNGVAFTNYTSSYNPATKVLEINFSVPALKGNAGAAIVATYQATLDASAFINDEGDGNTNTVVVVYKVDNDSTEKVTPPPVDPPPPRVFTFGFDIDKFAQDGSTKTQLAGAEFELSQNGVAIGFTVDAQGRYVYAPAGTPPASVTTTLVSSAAGKIFVRGLNVGTYSLKEIKAPDGYVLLDAPIEIVIAHTTGDGVPVITVNGSQLASGNVIIDVLNNLGSIFPETGGIGRTIFFIAGGLLMFGATTALVIRKKRASSGAQ